ncbi:hypothetical protein HMPREF0762_00383, partial [Slackia exigua ATCC 700122]
MRAEKDSYPVKMMARVLEVSRSGFYSWLAKGEPDDPWAGLRAEVKRVWLESDRTFGARFVLAFLPEEFAGTTLYRVRKCMKELGIRGNRPELQEEGHDPRRGRSGQARFDKARLHEPAAHLQARGRHHLPQDQGG